MLEGVQNNYFFGCFHSTFANPNASFLYGESCYDNAPPISELLIAVQRPPMSTHLEAVCQWTASFPLISLIAQHCLNLLFFPKTFGKKNPGFVSPDLSEKKQRIEPPIRRSVHSTSDSKTLLKERKKRNQHQLTGEK